MSLNNLSKFFIKIFNKKKYIQLKYHAQQNKKLNLYKEKISQKLAFIRENLKTKTELNFLHSGHLGDLIYSLAVIKELSKKYKCNFFVQINKKMDNYDNHPSGNVMINKKTAELLLPLLKSQKYLNSAKIYESEKIDVNLDLFREIPINILFHSVRWYSHITGTPIDMNEAFLDVEPHKLLKNKIVIMRSPRYRNQFINYNFLKDQKNIVCVGLKSEYEDLKKEISFLEFYDCKDFLEMAQIIKSSKFFLGNLCFSYSIAEGLKVPRLLEACPEFPVVFPIGKNSFDFYHQEDFQNYFNKLNF